MFPEKLGDVQGISVDTQKQRVSTDWVAESLGISIQEEWYHVTCREFEVSVHHPFHNNSPSFLEKKRM